MKLYKTFYDKQCIDTHIDFKKLGRFMFVISKMIICVMLFFVIKTLFVGLILPIFSKNTYRTEKRIAICLSTF